MLTFSVHLLSCRDNLSLKNVLFKNQNEYIPSWSGIFQLGIFLINALSESRRISASEPSFFFGICFSCYLSIWPFCYVHSVPIFYSKIILFPLHPVVDLSLWILLQQLVRWIFFCYFSRSWFVCIASPCSNIFWVFLLSSISFDLCLPIVLSDLPFIGLFPPLCHCLFFFPKSFRLLFFICFCNLISHPGLVFLFGFLWRYEYYYWLVLLQHKLARLVLWCCPLGYF